jgi:hypothetical protein
VLNRTGEINHNARLQNTVTPQGHHPKATLATSSYHAWCNPRPIL